MLVNEYLDQVIKSRPYKYSTKQTLIKDIRRIGIWDMDTSEITSALSASNSYLNDYAWHMAKLAQTQ